MLNHRRSNPLVARCALLAISLSTLAGTAVAQDASSDPPDRVARISFLRGNVSFQPAGDDQWAEASLNRPMSTGDKVYTDTDSRVELEVGDATLRLDQSSTFDLLNLDDNAAQAELTQGTMNLHVDRLANGESYEVDTPTLAFVASEPGDYRIDIDPQGTSTMVTVFAGAGAVYGENNASYTVQAGNTFKFNDSSLTDYEVLDVPRANEFDTWVTSREQRYTKSVARQYVSEDTIGYADLDDNGSWQDTPDYGHVWYPSRVEADWAPYRSGHWSWVDPWGWTWIDSQPWGFAPFHYGRWAYVNDRWGWCPGAYRERAIYAPALVAFVGGVSISVGGGGPVGWFPLGPRDVYVPWYRASRGYFTNVNVRNTTVINNVNITNVYNNYSRGGPITNVNYAYRGNARAVTAVSREAFVGSRAVSAGRVQINANNLRNAQVISRVGIAPQRASFAATGGRARPAPAAALNRQVIARTAPPARPAPIASRIQAIQRNDSQGLGRAQLRQIAAKPAARGATGAAAPANRVQVVGRGNAKPQPLPPRTAAPGQRPVAGAPAAATPRGGVAPTPARPSTPVNANAPTRPGAAPVRGPTPAARPGAPAATPGRSALPSSRFAPRGNTATPAPNNRAAVNPAQRDQPAAINSRNPTPSRPSALPNRSAPAATPSRPATPAPQVRQAPRPTPNTPALPQARSTPQPAARPQVQQRAMPPQQARPAVQQRPQVQQRPAVQQRPPVQARPMPQQAPRPQVQQRAMPQQQARPAVQQRPPVQQARPAPPQQRAQPQPRPQPRNDKDKDKDGH